MGKQKISIVGAGMGGRDQLTGVGARRLLEAQVVMGAKRLVQDVLAEPRGRIVFDSHRSGEMVEFLKSAEWSRAVFLVSGDTGFYSAATGALRAFEEQGWEVELVPGISCLSWFAARLGRSYQDLAVLSCHGRDTDPAVWVREHAASFLLLGGKTGVRELCQGLIASGLSGCSLWVGENLSYEEERIVSGTPEQILGADGERPFGSLCCAVVENPEAVSERKIVSFGLADSEFLRGKVPMTKSEVRALSLSKLRLAPGAVCYDVGSGTGSVAVEMGLFLKSCGGGQVYAVERKREALELTEANARKFLGSWEGFHLVEGAAPGALVSLPAPTHVFIGGSGGRLEEILEAVLQKNPGARIAVNALTLETLTELLACHKRFRFETWEVVQIAVSVFHEVGSYHMPQAANPVYIALMQGPAAGEAGV